MVSIFFVENKIEISKGNGQFEWRLMPGVVSLFKLAFRQGRKEIFERESYKNTVEKEVKAA